MSSTRVQVLLLICAIISTVLAGTDKDQLECSRTACKVSDRRKFKYEEDVFYWYKYSVNTSTNLGTPSNEYEAGNESTLFIDAVFSIHFVNPCEGILKVHNASISHDRVRYNPEFPDRADAEFRKNLQRFPLKFGFDDGQIHEICPDPRDPVWILNVKKGILSMLQNSMLRFDVDRRLDELDVHGICPTTYRLIEARQTSLIIRKTKNRNECMQGSKHLSIIQSNAYRSPVSSSHLRRRYPLVKSSSECDIIVDHNVYQKITCTDVHRLQPLATGQRGVKAESTANLELFEESKGGFSLDNEDVDESESDNQESNKFGQERGKRTTLLYDYGKTAKTMHGELRSTRDLLKQMCRLGGHVNEMQPRYSETFTSFVHSARLLDFPSLSQLFSRADSICKSGQKRITDALPYLGSNAAVNVMRDLIRKGKINKEVINNWVTTFALIPNPDRETIKILAPLLEATDQIEGVQFILSYSAVIHTYCKYNHAECGSIKEISRFITYLEGQIQRGCTPRFHPPSTNKDTLEALKAVGNMGLETQTLLATLQECIDDKGAFLPIEVRLAAIDAHRRLPSCETTRDHLFLNYYRNFTLDPEIRITSYLQIMRCPDYNVIKTIKYTLTEEEVNQVGTFVWSHLRNQYKSASPTKIKVQSLLTDKDLNAKFNSDVRKFSRNYEGSFFSEEYNFGANYEGNLIFSPKSYIPRTATFNASIDLFGESVNAFELSLRMEGLEYYAEKFFGPDGLYSGEKMGKHFGHFLRYFRAAPTNDYWEQAKRLPNVIDNNFDHPRVTIGYRIFGNELKYSILDGEKDISQAISEFNPWKKLKEIAFGKGIHYENALIFLDSTYILPMSTGLPVSLQVSGSTAYNLNLSGLFNATRLADGEFDLTTNVRPSVSIDGVGSMTVDAFYKSAGIKLRTNIYSSSALEIHLDVKSTHLVRLNLELPIQKMDVFSASTDIFFTRYNGAEIEERRLGLLVLEQKAKKPNRLVIPKDVISNTSCTWDALDRLIGLKLCVDYQLTNITTNMSAPYSVLKGPQLFKVSLIKADPTAKSYLLEYKWFKTEDQSVFRVAFETPGSQVNRQLSASVSFDVKLHNVTIILNSVGNSIVAKGTYKRMENETSIDLGFDINGVKHLDASIGYTTKLLSNGHSFHPNMYLTVNNEKVVAFSGTIRNVHKESITQCDIELLFQTKKMWSKLIGYIVKRNVSIAGDFQLEYRVQTMPRKETLHLEVSLSNRSSKNMIQKAADMKIKSSAYPQLNTAITTWYQQALGHLELHAEINSSPHLQDDRHKLTAQLIVSYSKVFFQNQGTKISVLFALSKPIQNFDIKVGINHYAVGAESKTNLLIGYAPGKQITLMVETNIPQGLMYSLEGHLNLTIPNFKPLLIAARINERLKREYELEFSGTWFSGHNITARGSYIDRSMAALISHSLKMILNSPSFRNDISVNCKLYQNFTDLRINLSAKELDYDKYAFIVNHTVLSATSVTTYVEGRFKNSVYAVTTKIDTDREIKLEVHLNNARDIHVTLVGINEDIHKKFGAEIKWDANRDPAMKATAYFLLDKTDERSLEESSNSERNTTAVVSVTYPGRQITGSGHLCARNLYNYVADLSFDWSAEKMIKVSIVTDYDVSEINRMMHLETQVLTPFENWKRTALNARYIQDENTVVITKSAYWKDTQYLKAEVYGSATRDTNISEWKVNCGLTSSIHSLSWITMNFTHNLINSHTVDTRLLVKYEPDKIIHAWSVWHLDKLTNSTFNISGNIHLDSPVTKYKRSDLKCQLNVLADWKFLGGANLLLDKKKYSANLIGDLFRLKESTIQFNVTTPLEKYPYIRGRFGLSEKKRHVVAEISTPAGPLGFEALCQLFTVDYNFNIKLLLATPVDILRKSQLIAKLNKREADFRIGYNNMTAGFQGAWYYNNITDFHYSYILYTPLEGLQECGVVTKLILNNDDRRMIGVDTEFSVRLAEVKIGVMANGGLKPPPVKIPLKITVGRTKEVATDELLDEEDEEDSEEREDDFYWSGEIEICTAIVEPIVGELNVDLEDSMYKVYSTLVIPQGKIIVEDNFWMEDVFHMTNELNVNTTFRSINKITSTYALIIDSENLSYMVEGDLRVQNNGTWTESGLYVNYTYSENEFDDSNRHTVKLVAKTPLDFLQSVTTRTTVDLHKNLSRVTVDIRTEKTSIDLSTSLEIEENFLDSALTAEVDSPLLKLPKTQIILKNDFTNSEKHIKFIADIAEPVKKSVFVQSSWKFDSHHVKASIALRTWIDVLKNLESELEYTNTISLNDSASLIACVKYLENQEYKITSNYSTGIVRADLFTPIPGKTHLQYHGVVRKVNDTQYHVNGDLTNSVTTDVQKLLITITTQKDKLNSIQGALVLKTPDSTEDEVQITVKSEAYELNLAATSSHLNGTFDMNFLNYYNWDVRAQAQTLRSASIDRYQMSAFMNIQVNGNATLYIHAESPAKQARNITIRGNAMLTNTTGSLRVNNHINEDSHYAALQWKLLYLEDMFGRLDAGYQNEEFGTKDIETQIFFVNPHRRLRNVVAGFDIDIDRTFWKFGMNGTVGIQKQGNVDAVLTVRLPPPDNDDHRFLLSYHANKGVQDMSYLLGYEAVQAKKNYASDGSIRMASQEIEGHLRFTWGLVPSKSLDNRFKMTFNAKAADLRYTLYAPTLLQKETAVILFLYDGAQHEYKRLISADVFYPETVELGRARVSYENIANINGTINATLPLANLTKLGCNFMVFTTLQRSKKFIEVFWPEDKAMLNSEYSYHSQKLNSEFEGLIHLEIPLNTRHTTRIAYGYKKHPQVTIGYSELWYNDQKVVDAKYDSKLESRAGFERNDILMTIENSFKPLGILYVNQYEYSGGNAGMNYPTTEYKRINVYQLDNRTAFNVAGESRIQTTHTGQEIYLQANHVNRTVKFKTVYEVLPGEFDQNTLLSLADDAWISYHVNILNNTTEDLDNQYLILNIAYPKRNFTLDGSYRIATGEFATEGTLEWDKDSEHPRSIAAAVNWTDITPNTKLMQQQAIFVLKHPSFEKDVLIKGMIFKNDSRDLLNTVFTIDYSKDEDKLFVLSTAVRDESRMPSYRKYVYKVHGQYPHAKLYLNINGFLHKYENLLFATANNASYWRRSLTRDSGRLNTHLDVVRKEVFFQREYNEIVKYLQVRYYPSPEEYVVNGSIINSPDLNATGQFFLDPRQNLMWMMVNYTPDAVESLRMYGRIPDARNAAFDIWRTYEDDFTVSDLSFYLKLNHSRLVTSTFQWRPELKSDIVDNTKRLIFETYTGLTNDIDYWKQYVKSESSSVISEIWDDAQTELRDLLDDWKNLSVLQEDFHDLTVYLNNSYNANDFYTKDIVAFGVYVIDELSLRNHIQSLPNILNEIWDIMGDSGEAIRNSLLWIIETIKLAYNKISDVIAAVFRGDSISQVADTIEKLIEKYDMFIKDIHVSLIKYAENLYNKISLTISQQWNRFLLLVEPMFIRVLHYAETVIWKASKEIVDFLYDRGNDIIASPYFDRFTNFTHDIDKLYRDMKGNDIITNIRKYSGLLMKIVKERYFSVVPFGKELKDVVEEIATELKELKKLPPICYAIEKIQQAYIKVYYFVEYFEIQTKLENLVRFVHAKVFDISQTALEAEDEYRDAKTKFIFDPHQGLICLEQKLPMSWHAFNQTPAFEEIPEFRAIIDFKSYFRISNITFWSLYYQYKPYTEPSNWLPPFKAQAMIIGPHYYKTFDGRYISFAGPNTYLLARDFVRSSFSVLVKYNMQPAKVMQEVIVLMGNNSISLDFFDDSIKITSQGSLSPTNVELPAELENGTIYIYQEENIISIKNRWNQFHLECNLMFNFCALDLSGWYYGKTAGLLGTMNNEWADDMMTSSGEVVKDMNEFGDSWSVNSIENSTEAEVVATPAAVNDRSVTEFCKEFFENGSSEFSSCFSVVDPHEFTDMCTYSTTMNDACGISMAYIHTCMFYDIYLRIPDACTFCSMPDGSSMAEGDLKRLEGSSVPQSGDIVFIVEAKQCNRDIKQGHSMEHLVTQLSKEFRDQGLTGNRWSLVAFGGDGVFSKPRSLIFDGQPFTKNVERFIDSFGRVPVGNGSEDIFEAIGFASRLVFRAGVSKTFVLLPCSHCTSDSQALDYSVVHQVLLEHGITLHVLMDNDFEFEKERLNKIFYGLDATKAYTKKDSKILEGDVDLRRQVKLSKSVLGYCIPLSLETNGTIFSRNKLRFEKPPSIKKFVTVFSKRVAQAAQPNACQNCECTADNNGATRMECMACVFPTPINVDYDTVSLNDSLASLQPHHGDYGFTHAEEE